ncbi:unnamed protein product [Colias eurytheme]|nr:unnamed protein product [Colias eurytheme]
MGCCKNKLKLGFLNPGSLGNKHDEFIIAMENHCVDIMAINETGGGKKDAHRLSLDTSYVTCLARAVSAPVVAGLAFT